MTLSKAGFRPHRSFSVANNTLFHLQDCLHRCMYNVLYHTSKYNRLLEDEPSGSKHVEDNTKIKIIVYKRCILLVYIVQFYYNVRCQIIKFLYNLFSFWTTCCLKYFPTMSYTYKESRHLEYVCLRVRACVRACVCARPESGHLWPAAPFSALVTSSMPSFSRWCHTVRCTTMFIWPPCTPFNDRDLSSHSCGLIISIFSMLYFPYFNACNLNK
jgi:hypothetical protein